MIQIFKYDRQAPASIKPNIPSPTKGPTNQRLHPPFFKSAPVRIFSSANEAIDFAIEMSKHHLDSDILVSLSSGDRVFHAGEEITK
jgi:hypothetical protein